MNGRKVQRDLLIKLTLYALSHKIMSCKILNE